MNGDISQQITERQLERRRKTREIFGEALRRRIQTEGEEHWIVDDDTLTDWLLSMVDDDEIFKEQMEAAFPGWEAQFPYLDPEDDSYALMDEELWVYLQNELKLLKA